MINQTLNGNDFIVWVNDWQEAEETVDSLDGIAAAHGIGANAFRIAIMPDDNKPREFCPFDTVFLNDKGRAEVEQGYIVTPG